MNDWWVWLRGEVCDLMGWRLFMADEPRIRVDE